MIDRFAARGMLLGTLLVLLAVPAPVLAADPDGSSGGALAREDDPESTPRDPESTPRTPRPPSRSLGSHVFPIRGPHDLGQSPTNGFGGGRGHQGQDMFAACGTRLVAARGGTVKMAGSEGAAGNYVVIDGDRTGLSYVYMHMLRSSLVRTGERVRAGQPIGQVGATGRASGCHLHFELWSGPGWRAGGRPFDPLPYLRAWDDAD